MSASKSRRAAWRDRAAAWRTSSQSTSGGLPPGLLPGSCAWNQAPTLDVDSDSISLHSDLGVELGRGLCGGLERELGAQSEGPPGDRRLKSTGCSPSFDDE